MKDHEVMNEPDSCAVSSVARWLSPKPAKSGHEKLLDPSKKHVTKFYLQSAKNSEILLNKTVIFEVFKTDL